GCWFGAALHRTERRRYLKRAGYVKMESEATGLNVEASAFEHMAVGVMRGPQHFEYIGVRLQSHQVGNGRFGANGTNLSSRSRHLPFEHFADERIDRKRFGLGPGNPIVW